MKMSNVRSVDRRRSKSLIVALIDETGLLSSEAEVGAVSCESRPLYSGKDWYKKNGIDYSPASEATGIRGITTPV